MIFIYVSDDIDWGKTRLLPRVVFHQFDHILCIKSKNCVMFFAQKVKTGDLYFVEDFLPGNKADSLPEQVGG